MLASGVTKGAIWSAEHLTADMVAAARDTVRASEFFADDRLPPADQALNEDYRRSGLDRGHMTPSGDMPDGDAQQQSFSLANMVPQSPQLNRGVWAGIETAVGWLGDQWFSVPFTYWKWQLEERPDIVRGYRSSTEGTAANLTRSSRRAAQPCSIGRPTSLLAAPSWSRSTPRRPGAAPTCSSSQRTTI